MATLSKIHYYSLSLEVCQMKRVLFFLNILPAMHLVQNLAASPPVCDITDCGGTVSLLGGAAIGGNTSLVSTTTATTVTTSAAGVSTATVVSNTLNVSAPPSMPSAPAAAFADPRSGKSYYTLPNINANFTSAVTEANLPTTQSASTTFNPTATQPSAPFNDPVTTPGYYAVPTTASTSVISTSITSVTGSSSAP